LGEPHHVLPDPNTLSSEGWGYTYLRPDQTTSWPNWYIAVDFQEDGTVRELGIDFALSLGQLVEVIGEPSSAERRWAGEHADKPWTALLYDDRSITAIIWNALCPDNYPAGILVNYIIVEPEGAYLRRVLAGDVEMEWTGVTNDRESGDKS
jgi:hypothetical protein